MYATFEPVTQAAAADVLVALLGAGVGCEKPAVRALDGLDAFERLGVCRDSVLSKAEAAREAHQESFATLFSPVQQLRRAGTLDVIESEEQRLLLCRLAAAVLTADGRIQPEERRLYDHLLATWGLTHADVAAAIRSDPAN